MASRAAIVNVGYRSTNYYVVGQGPKRLLVDLGWPGSLPELTSAMKRKGLALAQITHAFATHYHPDHAGLAEELKRAGALLIVIDAQVPAVGQLRRHVKPGDGFVEISLHDAVVLSTGESRAYLATLGLAGEIVATPGHSDDSMTLVLDSGEAFTGDLTAPELAFGENEDVIRRSWSAIRALGATTLYPGHGPARALAPEPR